MYITTTYQYKALESERYIRLLKIQGLNVERQLCRWDLMARIPTFLKLRGFEIIHASVDDNIQYEAVSYAWGDSIRVAELPIAKAHGHIALTQSLVKALPYLARASRTGLLWIDQICISQADLQEREQQVALMGEVFGNSTRTLIWLDLDDYSGRMVANYLSEVKSYRIKDHPYRFREVKDLTKRPDWKFGTPEFTDAVLTFYNCSWMSRAWVIQEYLLSSYPVFLWGKRMFCDQDLEDLMLVTTNNLLKSHGRLDLKWRDNLTTPRIFRRRILSDSHQVFWSDWSEIFVSVAGDFETSIERDGLLAYLGIWKPPSFQPSYTAPLQEMYTDFARCFCKDTGSLDFLSINESRRARGYRVCQEFSAQQLPVWVPVWPKAAFNLPSNLIDNWICSAKCLNAASNRGHEYLQSPTPSQLAVRGKIIDRVVFTSNGKLPNTIKTADYLGYLEEAIHELSNTSRNGHCTVAKLVTMARECAGYDNHYFEPGTEMVEKLVNPVLWLKERKVILSESGRLGMAPSWCEEGYVIAIIHGCRVPLILDKDESASTYTVIGDCYLEGAMHGEAVTWEVDQADEFVLS